MTSYKYVVLVVLAALVGGGWFGLGRANQRVDSAYEGHLAAARASATLGVTGDATTEYRAALAIRPTYAIAWELAEFLKVDGDPEDYRGVLANLVSSYPDVADPYLALAELKVGEDDLAEAYDTLTSAREAGVEDPRVVTLQQRIRYRYDISATSYTEATTFVGALASVRTPDGWRVLNGEGSSLSRSFDAVGVLVDGKINVVIDGRPSFIDRAGEIVLEARRASYTEYGPMHENIIPARTADGLVTYLDARFQPLFEGRTFTDGTSFAGGLAAVSDGTSWNVIDREGSKVAGPFSSVTRSDGGDLVAQDRFFAETADGFRLYDAEGGAVGSTVYADARAFGPDGPAAVKTSAGWGFVNADGTQALTETYDAARSFVNGVAAVAEGDRWGYVNEAGVVVIPMIFSAATDFSPDGAAMVGLRGLETGVDPSAPAADDEGEATPTSSPAPTTQAPVEPPVPTDAADGPAAGSEEAGASAGTGDAPLAAEDDKIRWHMLKLKRFVR